MISSQEMQAILSEVGQRIWAATHKTCTFCHGLRESCSHIKDISTRSLSPAQRRTIFQTWEEGLDVALGNEPERIARFKRLPMYIAALAVLDPPRIIDVADLSDDYPKSDAGAFVRPFVVAAGMTSIRH